MIRPETSYINICDIVKIVFFKGVTLHFHPCENILEECSH